MSEDLFFHLHPSVDRCLIENQWTISKNPWGRLCGVNDLQGETVEKNKGEKRGREIILNYQEK